MLQDSAEVELQLWWSDTGEVEYIQVLLDLLWRSGQVSFSHSLYYVV